MIFCFLGNDTVVNVLDDILDANTGDDDLIVEMASEGKIGNTFLILKLINPTFSALKH